MRTLLALILGAFCAVTAQAVNVKWSSLAGGQLPQTGNTQNQTALIADTSSYQGLSIALTMKLVALKGNANYAEFSGTNLTRVGFRLQGNIFYAAQNGKKIADSQGVALTAGETFAFVLTFDGGNLNFYVNGTKIYTMEQTLPSSLSAGIWIGEESNKTYAVDPSMVIYDGALTEGQIAWMNEHKTALLPEPTALALLALGVAGLALRRKTA